MKILFFFLLLAFATTACIRNDDGSNPETIDHEFISKQDSATGNANKISDVEPKEIKPPRR